MSSLPSFLLFLPVFACFALVSTSLGTSGGRAVKGAYWYYGSSLPAAQIDASPYTHIFYAFASMDNSSFVVQPAADDNQIQSFSSTIRNSSPSVKLLLSIGGGGSDEDAFSAMASHPTSRHIFIQSSINLAKQYGFNGLDLDWEFPETAKDMDNLASLFTEWRKAANSLLLTAAVYYNVTRKGTEVATFPVRAITQNLDWVNLMEYDLHGSWEPHQTGEHTALYDTGVLSVNYGVTNWLASGLPAHKAAMGLAMYGRTWYLKNASQNGVGAPANGAGPNRGVYTYDQIQQFNKDASASCQVDDRTKCAYCYGTTSNGTLWVGYDNIQTISTKVTYLKQKKIGGYIFWSLSGDKKGDLGKQASQILGRSKMGADPI